MQAVRQKSDNLIMYVGANLTTDEITNLGDGWCDARVTPILAEVITLTSLPLGFVPNGWTYDDTTWTVVEGFETQVDVIINTPVNAVPVINEGDITTGSVLAADGSVKAFIDVPFSSALTASSYEIRYKTAGGGAPEVVIAASNYTYEPYNIIIQKPDATTESVEIYPDEFLGIIKMVKAASDNRLVIAYYQTMAMLGSPPSSNDSMWLRVNDAGTIRTIIIFQNAGDLYLYSNTVLAMDMTPNGVIVCAYSISSYGTPSGTSLCVRVSTDFGVTFSDMIIVVNDPTFVAAFDYINIKIADDGTIYVLTFLNNLGLYKSTDNGATWSHVSLPSDFADIGYQSMAVSGNYLYIVGYTASPNTPGDYTLRSSDGGTTWDANLTNLNSTSTTIRYSANGLVVIAILGTLTTWPAYTYEIYRSTDGGITFTLVHTITDGQYDMYAILTNDGSTFVYTYCGMNYGIGFLAYLISVDNGVTWNLVSTLIPYDNGTSGYLQQSVAVLAGGGGLWSSKTLLDSRTLLNTYRIDGLLPGTDYLISIRAFTQWGVTAWSSDVAVTAATQASGLDTTNTTVTALATTVSGLPTITRSTSTPTGGVDGDIWYQYFTNGTTLTRTWIKVSGTWY
jgi:hypothetical protein